MIRRRQAAGKTLEVESLFMTMPQYRITGRRRLIKSGRQRIKKTLRRRETLDQAIRPHKAMRR
jgi:hypothetical protein